MILFFLLFLIIPTIFSCDSTVCKEATQLLQNIWELRNFENATIHLPDYFTDDFNLRLCDAFSIEDVEFFFNVTFKALNESQRPKILNASVEPSASNQRFINFDIDYKNDSRLSFQLSAKEVNGTLKIYKGHIITHKELANIQRKCESADCSDAKHLLRNLWEFKNFFIPYFRLNNVFTSNFQFSECDINGGGIIERGTFWLRHVAYSDYIPKVFNATSYTLKTIELYPASPVYGGDLQPPSTYEFEENFKSFFCKNDDGQYFHLKAKEVDGVFKFYEGSCHQQNC